MKLYGFWRSLASYRVRVALALKGLQAEEISIDLLKGKQHESDYLAVNPQGVVPALVLDEGGAPLVQSLAILEYLEEVRPQPPLCREAAPGLVAVNWWGVLLPAGSPKAIVDKLNADTVKALADPDVKKRFADLGVEAVSSTPEQFAAFIRDEMAKYAKLIKEANIKVNP